MTEILWRNEQEAGTTVPQSTPAPSSYWQLWPLALLLATEATVKGYVSEILSKLQVAGRTQAALLAVRYGVVAIDELPRAP